MRGLAWRAITWQVAAPGESESRSRWHPSASEITLSCVPSGKGQEQRARLSSNQRKWGSCWVRSIIGRRLERISLLQRAYYRPGSDAGSCLGCFRLPASSRCGGATGYVSRRPNVPQRAQGLVTTVPCPQRPMPQPFARSAIREQTNRDPSHHPKLPHARRQDAEARLVVLQPCRLGSRR